MKCREVVNSFDVFGKCYLKWKEFLIIDNFYDFTSNDELHAHGKAKEKSCMT